MNSFTTKQTPQRPQHDNPERYQWMQKIGEGSWGAVYLAWDRKLQHHVACKIPRKHDHQTSNALLQEAHIQRSLKHQGILPIIDIGILSDGRPFYTTPYIPGEDLEQKRLKSNITPKESIRIIQDLCDILQYIHSQGIAHSDLKPANILIGDDATVYLIDWGTAEHFNTNNPNTTTQQDVQLMLKGTPLYLAPELIAGDPISPASDLYALGVLMYELWTGQCPFYDENLVTLFYKTYNDEPVPPTQHNPQLQLSQELEQVCMKLLSKQPQARFSSCQELHEVLKQIPILPKTKRLHPTWFAPPLFDLQSFLNTKSTIPNYA